VTLPLRPLVRRLPGSGGLDVEISLSVPSALEYVADAVDVIARHCADAPLSARVLRFNLRVALAEALANAILYGNREDASKNVRIRAELSRDGVRLLVSDEGPGFDPSSVPDPTDTPRIGREAGRGLFVIRQLADEVTFNAEGNGVCLIFRSH